MLFPRKLLTPKVHYEIIVKDVKDIALNCINGYLIPNSSICTCYPGWSSDYNSLDQCNIDSGENNTNSKRGIIYNNDDPKDKGTSANVIIFLIVLILLVIGVVCALFMYLFKKYKDIKLVKEKIKFEKNRNINLSQNNDINQREDSKEKDINCVQNNKENEKELDTVCLDVLNETDLHSHRNTENNEK